MTTPFQMKLPYPEDRQPFRCPVCSVSYKMFTSFTRHLGAKHTGEVSLSFQCSQCEQTFLTKRSVSIHFAKTHVLREQSTPSARPTSHLSLDIEGLQCPYCEEKLPSKRSLGQHTRNQHAAMTVTKKQPTLVQDNGPLLNMHCSWMLLQSLDLLQMWSLQRLLAPRQRSKLACTSGFS